MKPIYFPFTYISKQVAEALQACFGKIIVHQPSSKNIPEEVHRLSERSVVDIRISGNPEKQYEEKLSAILKDYHAWADLHQGSRRIQLDFFKAGRNKIPFFDDTSSSQIKADIKDITDETRIRKEPDPVFNARIFLSIAQNYDKQNDKISQDMASVETARRDLIKTLKGEDETSPGVPGYGDEFKTDHSPDDDHMIPERIEAWALLICRDLMQCRYEVPDLFVTSSRQAIDYLLEKAPETENVFSIDTVPLVEKQDEKKAIWLKDLMEYLENVAESSMPLKCDPFTMGFDDFKSETNVALSLYLVPRVSPLDYFSRFTRFDSNCSKLKKDRGKNKNTLIGHIGFSA